MIHQELTTLHYDNDRSGTLALYLYNANGQHTGPRYFGHGAGELSAARKRVEQNIRDSREVRITNGSDFLVFHFKDGKQIHPPTVEAFWKELGA